MPCACTKVIRTSVDPTTALTVGLKVDVDALPATLQAGIQSGSVDLKSPDTTVALLKLDAVVGLRGTVETVNGKDTLTHVGITCALCHSTVDNCVRARDRQASRRLAEPRPQRRRDRRALPALSASVKAVYNSGDRASTIRASIRTARTARS
jgi:hypothetical protein